MPLRIPAEQQHRGVGRPPPLQQVKLCQQFARVPIFGQRKITQSAGAGDEPPQALRIQVAQHGAVAVCGIEIVPPHQQAVFHVLRQSRIQPGEQFRHAVEAAADQFPFRPGDQGRHPLVARRARAALDEDQPRLSQFAGIAELALGRRHSVRVRSAVIVAEQPQVQVALPQLLQIHLLRPPTDRGHVLEQKNVEASVQERAFPEMRTQGRPLPGELLLHAADENPLPAHVPACPSGPLASREVGIIPRL